MAVTGAMRLAVVGCRDYDDYGAIADRLSTIPADVIISGGATGVDAAAKRYALRYCIPYVEYPADWKNLGLRAGPIRNQQIVDDCTHLIAFWDGKSRGTQGSIKLARRAKKLLEVVRH
jgi:YspA, cpYpsA-related SLOG family